MNYLKYHLIIDSMIDFALDVTCANTPLLWNSFLPTISTRQRRVFDLSFLFSKDMQHCLLLYDVISEIQNTKFTLNCLLTPSHTSCFRLLTLLSPAFQAGTRYNNPTCKYGWIPCIPVASTGAITIGSNFDRAFEHVLQGSSTHPVFGRPESC